MLCFVAHQKNNRIYDYLFDYWNNSDSLLSVLVIGVIYEISVYPISYDPES